MDTYQIGFTRSGLQEIEFFVCVKRVNLYMLDFGLEIMCIGSAIALC